MSGESLRFEEIRIRRTPGFEREGFTLGALCAGVNLVHGPNGSGKSTTARAMARLLWPGDGDRERVSLSGKYRLGEEEWEVEVDGGRELHRRAGRDAPPPVLPPASDQQRYRLSLHDLLHERDMNFARAVVRESAGGYDLNAAGAVLEPRSAPPRRSAAQEELEQAHAAHDRAVAQQRELQEEERKLVELRRQWEEAKGATQRVGLLEAALDHAAARDAESQARESLARFPGGIERVGGTEYDQLCKLRERLRKIAEEADRASAAQEEAQRLIERNVVAAELRGEEIVGGLERDAAALRDTERRAAEAARAAAAAKRKVETDATLIAGAVSPERLAALDNAAMGSLSAFAQRAGEVQAQRAALEHELGMLGEAKPTLERARLEEGIRCLEGWLRTPPAGATTAADPGARRGMLIAAGVLLALVVLALLKVVGVLEGALIDALLLIAPLLGLLLIAIQLRDPSAAGAGADERELHRKGYERLQLEAPEAWDPGRVEQVLQRLQTQAIAARLEEEREARRTELRGRLRANAEAQLEVERRKAELEERLGVEPETTPAQLVWLVDGVSRWQSGHRDWVAAEEEARVASEQAERRAAELRRRLERMGYAELETTGALEGAISALEQRCRVLDGAEKDFETAARELERLERERVERSRDAEEIFERLGLERDTDDTVKEWCERRQEYQGVREHHQGRLAALHDAARRLLERGGDEALAATSSTELEAELEEARLRAAGRDDLRAEISRIEAGIDAAKRSHGIEEALERIERAREQVRQAREKDIRGMIASELLAWVEQATRDRHLPAVFHRAREIFTRITRGRYELRLLREGEPQFAAFDTVDRRERALEELSSGTRVQLLIAVRVAFVEQQEQGVKLPLVLDEVLGNSDEERARAVMEAALELAGEGRQIFYFTAQADEVARWRQLIGNGATAVEVREIDLAAVRGMERRIEIPPLQPSARRGPPPPTGADHAEYGRLLGVPRLDRATEEVAGVHLWYLLDDAEALHGLLRLGPERWGALEALTRDGGRLLVDEQVMEALRIRVRAAEAFLDAARVGVGRRVDRAVLEDSGAVTPTFIDRVARLSQEVGGDGARLMEALENQRVARFPTRARDSLRDYLEENGYCPAIPPFDPPEVRERVLRHLAVDIAAGTASIEEIDRLLDRLWAGVEIR